MKVSRWNPEEDYTDTFKDQSSSHQAASTQASTSPEPSKPTPKVEATKRSASNASSTEAQTDAKDSHDAAASLGVIKLTNSPAWISPGTPEATEKGASAKSPFKLSSSSSSSLDVATQAAILEASQESAARKNAAADAAAREAAMKEVAAAKEATLKQEEEEAAAKAEAEAKKAAEEAAAKEQAAKEAAEAAAAKKEAEKKAAEIAAAKKAKREEAAAKAAKEAEEKARAREKAAQERAQKWEATKREMAQKRDAAKKALQEKLSGLSKKEESADAVVEATPQAAETPQPAKSTAPVAAKAAGAVAAGAVLGASTQDKAAAPGVAGVSSANAAQAPFSARQAQDPDATVLAPLPQEAAPLKPVQQSAAASNVNMVNSLDPSEQEAYSQLLRMREERKRARLLKLAAVGAAALLAVCIFFAWRTSQNGSQSTERMVTTQAAYINTFSSEVSTSGAIQPASSTAVTPQIDGTIESVKVVAGQSVKKGDVLFTIKNDQLDRDVTEAERGVTSAQSALNQAIDSYNAIVDTIQQNGTGSIDSNSDEAYALSEASSAVESAQMSLDSARETYNTAVSQAEQRNITAPVDGNIIELNATPGTAVSQATANGALCKVADLSQMKVNVQVGENDVDKVAVGQTAKLTFSALEGVELDAEVVSVASVSTGSSDDVYGGDSTSGGANYAVELLVPKPDNRLKPGMTAQVNIITQQIRDALIVPTLALNDAGDGLSSLSIEVDPETHEMRYVTVKVEAKNDTDAAVSVVEGELNEGDAVVVSDSDAFSDLDTYGDVYTEDMAVS